MLSFLSKYIHQSWLVVFLCIGIILGIIIGLIFRINYFASPIWILIIIILLVVSYLRPKTVFLIIVLILGMVLAFFRISVELYGENYIKQFYGLNIEVAGTIDGDPETDENSTDFKIINLAFGPDRVASRGILYVSGFKNEKLARGDKVILSGKISEGFGIYTGYLYKPKIIKWERPEPGSLILKIRNWFAERVKKSLSENASLGLSYLMGMKSNLPDELSEGLRIVGLTHIVVASGAHLSILVEIARKIFGKISRFIGLLFSVLFILFFMSMVGWTPSILRAGVMATLTLASWYVGRKIAPWRIILTVIAFTLMLNPMFIINLGWLLSFASYAGIMILGPKLEKFFYGEKKPGFIASLIITTISATLMTLPITIYYYGQISLISVIANLLILPTLPYAMGLTFLTGVVAEIPGLEMIFSWCATKLLDFHILVVDFFGKMEQLLVKVSPYQPQVFFIYGLIIIPLFYVQKEQKMVKLREVRYKIRKFFKGENMSGHSKWATTKRQKAVVDAKRGALFTKIGNQIAIAARAGTDPAMNPSLAMVLEKARLANMPKANIERAIARVADKSAAALIEEVYEAYGPGGVGIVIEVATDNKNRTMPEVRHTLDKNGGRMADPGSVMFQFKRKGVIEISEKGEDALMVALEAGAGDATEEDDGIMIYTESSDLMKVRQALVDAGMSVTSAELQYVPTSYVSIEGDNSEKLEKLLLAIDDLDDVTNVYTNAE